MLVEVLCYKALGKLGQCGETVPPTKDRRFLGYVGIIIKKH